MMMRNWQKLQWFCCCSSLCLQCRASLLQNMLRLYCVGFVREEGYLTIDQKGYYSGYAYEYLQTLSQYGSWRCE